jgi:MoaA/NifB/PqqE/SkfB family radical SAM enzyme
MEKFIKTPWCINPFITFSISSDGKYRLCCQSREIENYDINNMHVEDYFSSEFINNIRHDMLNKNMSKEIYYLCKSCIKEEDKGLVSKRMKDNRSHNRKPKTIKSVNNFIKNSNGYDILNIRFLDINMLGNLCNYKCIMCWYKSSSRISAENVINNLNIDNNESIIVPYDSEKSKKIFFDTIFDIFQTVDKINFFGGEPLIHPDFEEIIEKLSNSHNANNIEVYIISNGSHIPDYIFSKSKKFKNFKLLISIDGVSDKAEYIRFGTKWRIFHNNIDKLVYNNINLTFNVAIQMLNVGYMDEIYGYLINKKIKENQIFNCYVNYPEYFDAINLPAEIKQSYLNRLEKDKNYKFYQSKVESILKSEFYDNKIFKDGISKLKFYDKIRKNNLLDNFPEFSEYYFL